MAWVVWLVPSSHRVSRRSRWGFSRSVRLHQESLEQDASLKKKFGTSKLIKPPAKSTENLDDLD